MTNQDGSPIGPLNTFAIGADGTITGTYHQRPDPHAGPGGGRDLRQPARPRPTTAAIYTRPAPTAATPVITTAEQLGTGAIRSGALEQSNVDLSQQFINLIVASTGYSASSRVISTSNQLLTDLLNIQTR